MSAHENWIWDGTCQTCGHYQEIGQEDLYEQVNEDERAHLERTGVFTTDCPQCKAVIMLTRTSAKMAPFSAWTVLPAAQGCEECGRDHEPQLPHDRESLVYQYRFRSREAQAGREERWPTWLDAMAHCTPEIRQLWAEELATYGITVEPTTPDT
jgi:hypothetical protein